MDNNKKKEPSLAAVIFAAGKGRRIGMPKWQIEYKGKTFLEIVAEKLRCSLIDNIICVKRKTFGIKLEGMLYVDNITPELGMVSSLFYAAQSYPMFDGYLILPVDHPFIEVLTIIELKKAFGSNPSKVVRPTYNGIPGHPIFIPNSLVHFMKNPDYAGGLRQLIKESKTEIVDMNVNDPNILKNVNLASDLN
ncbi:MAG: NTP transferase domain-containing protein [Lentisphaerota bacterium]